MRFLIHSIHSYLVLLFKKYLLIAASVATMGSKLVTLFIRSIIVILPKVLISIKEEFLVRLERPEFTPAK